MTKTRRRIVLAAGVLAYAVVAVVFFQAYRGYLRRPTSPMWDDVNGLFSDAAVYHGEPVVFDPAWLRHYAVDWGRMAQARIRDPGDAPVWWLITDRPFDASGFAVLDRRRFGTIHVYKLKAKGPPAS